MKNNINPKSKIIETIKENKFTSFVALGGVAMLTGMTIGMTDPSLMVPKIAMGIGALGVGKFYYELKKKKDFKFQPKLSKGAFLALGGLAATVAFQYYNLPIQGVGQLLLDSVAAYGTIMLEKSLFGTKKAEENNPNFINVKEKQETKSAISKIREKATEPNLEFKPLDLTRR